MKERIAKRPSYANYRLLTKDAFYNFAINDAEFDRLFEIWLDNDYKLIHKPVVDRIDSNKGYALTNIQFLSFSENVSKSNKEYPKSTEAANRAQRRQVILWNKNSKLLFESLAQARDFLGYKDSSGLVDMIQSKSIRKGFKAQYAAPHGG